ncbi:MAG: hypothetical protein VW684_11960, partial [Betaproteobacteria bacterium]
LDGYFEAGLLVKLVTRDEIQKAIDAKHLEIFGKTRQERKLESCVAAESGCENRDWSVYDLPPNHRKR